MSLTNQQRPCRKCGCPLALIQGPNGKAIPLDLRSPVYRVVEDMAGLESAQRDVGAFVSHFCTCPEANAFNTKRRKR